LNYFYQKKFHSLVESRCYFLHCLPTVVLRLLRQAIPEFCFELTLVFLSSVEYDCAEKWRPQLLIWICCGDVCLSLCLPCPYHDLYRDVVVCYGVCSDLASCYSLRRLSYLMPALSSCRDGIFCT